VQSFRSQLTPGADVVDPVTWAGAIPQAHGVAPRVRVGRSRWFNLLWLLPIGFVVLIVAVAAAKGLRATPSVERFIERYPGTVGTAGFAPNPGLPLWVGAYFITVFLAAPLTVITGLGMSPALSTRFKRISKVLSIQTARSLHFLVLVWFLLFIVIHVTLVFTTGLLRNLNHIYVGRNDGSWTGFAVFAVSMVVVIVGWVAATPFTLRHPRVVQRVGFALIGPAQRLFEHLDSTPGEYTDKDISPYFWHNGQYPDSPEYRALLQGNFVGYRLRINGLVDHPVDLDLAQLRALPPHEQITQHFCIQGWSGIAKWGGVSMQTIVDLVTPQPEAKWVVFYSLGDGPDKGVYYDAHPIEQMSYHLTMLAYDMNGQPLSFGHGAPLRLRNETQLGFKQVKWIKGVEFVADYSQLGGGYGGYNQDHEFFGYRQSI